MTDDQWDALAAERGASPEAPQGDLFDAELPLEAAARTAAPAAAKPKPAADPAARLMKVLNGNDD